jgi:hypothetical protein
MTNAEMNRRLATLSPAAIDRVELLIKQGYGAEGIKHETGLKVSQINAVFQKVQG